MTGSHLDHNSIPLTAVLRVDSRQGNYLKHYEDVGRREWLFRLGWRKQTLESGCILKIKLIRHTGALTVEGGARECLWWHQGSSTKQKDGETLCPWGVCGGLGSYNPEFPVGHV